MTFSVLLQWAEYVVAQAASAPLPESFPAWINSGSALIGPGFTIWYAWHTTYKTIPAYAEQHRQERKEMMELHRLERDEMRQQFTAALAALQTKYEADIALIIDLAKGK